MSSSSHGTVRHPAASGLRVTWLGHSTVLLDFFGIMALVDPALRMRIGVGVGPLTLGPKVQTTVYRVPVVHYRVKAVLTHTMATGAYRGASDPRKDGEALWPGTIEVPFFTVTRY